MKKFTLLTQFALSLLCTTTIAMEKYPIDYQQATNQHVQPIVDVINKYAVKDNTKIVILPEKFRSMAVKDDIAKKRLYCATSKQFNDVLAFKKLFIIDNEQEYDDITINEIRCTSNNQCLQTITLHPQDTPNPCKAMPFSFKDNAVIYFGGDYTIPAYRNQKINSSLTRHAFDSIKQDTIDIIKKNNFDNIVLLYGLTKANAGEQGGIDRTPSIVRAFRKFAEQVSAQVLNEPAPEDNIIIHSRYAAFMPTFDPKSTECKPLPDDKSIPGYGNVLVFPLNK